MTDKEIIKALECCRDAIHNVASCKECPYYEKENCSVISTNDILDLINRQQEQLNATIAGQETIEKAFEERGREILAINSDLKLLRNDYDYLKKNFDDTIEKNKRLRDKVVGLTAEKEQLIKTFGECQERAVKDFAKAFIDGIDEGYISHSSDVVDFTNDYLSGKMAGDTE